MKANWLILIFLVNSYLSNCDEAGKNTTNAFFEDIKKLLPLYQNCATHDNTLISDRCDCGIECTKFDTCCPDSVYRNVKTPQIKPSCRSINSNYYGFFMIDQCPTENDSDAALKHLCEEDYYKKDDLMRQIPVTSLLSNVTYKNYFCFRCHEINEDFVFWLLTLSYNSTLSTEVRDESISLSYNSIEETLLASFEKDGPMVDVEIEIVPHFTINYAVTNCILNIKSTCAENWKDNETRNKCSAYTFNANIRASGHVYKNPHCALCNFEDLNLMYFVKVKPCGSFVTYGYVHGGYGGVNYGFSFTYLFDINPSGGTKVGRKVLCDEPTVWDPRSEKCRTAGCIVPGYIIRKYKCVPP